MLLACFPLATSLPFAVPAHCTFAPQDTQICAGARVFYVAYNWVAEHWPDNLEMPDNHITAHPIRFYLDGQDTEVELTAKLRLYRKAVHLVICEYGGRYSKAVKLRREAVQQRWSRAL